MAGVERPKIGSTAVTRTARACLILILVAGFALTAKAQEPSAAQPAEAAENWLKRGELTGGWGPREKLATGGATTLDASISQFFHSSPEGDDDRTFEYGGKVEVKTKTGLGKWLGNTSSLDTHFEFRYKHVPVFAGGVLIPTSSALLFPESEDAHGRISSFYYTQVFGGKYVLQVGRFNTVDLYSASHPFTGGEGVDRFMNLSLVAPPVSARTVPPIAEGAMFSILRGATPAVTVGVIESTEEGFFENGVTVLWSVRPSWKFSSKPGGIAFGGEISSFEGTSLDQSPWALLPDSPIPLETKQGTWTVNVTVDQYLRMHSADPAKGWGFFAMLAVSDGNPSFLDIQAFAGLGGTAPFAQRSLDTWGVGLFANGVSGDLQDTIGPFLRTRDEKGIELFYSWAPVGWSRVTADIQVIDPFVVRSETRLFAAVRWKLML